jgi:predicted metal-dependent enzyme (double-stranded beta helix superfamily)
MTTALHHGLAQFVTRAIRLHRQPSSAGVRRRDLAQAMRVLLRCPRLLTDDQMIPAEGDGYRTVLLWSDASLNLSLLALVWRSGQRTPIHDHHAACIVGLYCGAERETRYERTAPGAETVVPVSETILRAGMVTVVPPGEHDIHRVEAVEQAPAVTVSLHFYEVDVTRQPGGSSIRQRFSELIANPGQSFLVGSRTSVRRS